MPDDKNTGKTWPDIIYAVVIEKRLLGIVGGVALGLVLALTCLWFFIERSAEPGTKITFLGLAYIKGKPITLLTTEPLQKRRVKGYMLPNGAAMPDINSLPILDGALALRRDVAISYRSRDGKPLSDDNIELIDTPMPSWELIGINIEKLKVSARYTDGTKAPMYRTGGISLHFSSNQRIELEYMANYFAITVTHRIADDQLIVTVENIEAPTLDLVAFNEVLTKSF